MTAYKEGRGGFNGIGYVLSESDPFVGVDLDNCVDPETGVILPWASEVIRDLDTYTEYSPSMTGLRSILIGKLPPEGRHRGDVEVYETKRFLTITGAHLKGMAQTVNERQEQLGAFHRRFFAKPERQQRDERDQPQDPAPIEDDRELIEKAMSAKNGDAFRRLWNGDTSTYANPNNEGRSEADLALCDKVAFYAGPDPARIERIVRQSRLRRTKWDSKRGDSTWIQETIAKALKGRTEFYTGGRRQGGQSSQDDAAPATPWDAPLPFEERAVPPFPTDALPGRVGEYVSALAEAYQVPADLPGVLVLGAGAAAGAGRVVVRLAPDWREPVNLYLLSVLASGERKSPTFVPVMHPLQERERELVAAGRPDAARAADEREVLDKALQNAKHEAARVKDGERDAAMQRVADLRRKLEECVVPPMPRLLADDATPEAVASLLAQYGRIAIASTEGGIFETMAGRYSQGVPNLDVYLKGYSGDSLRVDRQGRPPAHVPRPALTMVLTVQPAVVQDLATKPGFRGRGLLARFLYSIPASMVGSRAVDAEPVPAALHQAWDATIRAILRLPDPPPDKDEREMVLSPDAWAIFRDFRVTAETAMRPGGDLDGLQDWGNKYPGTVARIAGVLHLFKHADMGVPWDKPISPVTVQVAIEIGEYFAEHAKAAFAMMGADPAVADAKHVLAWIRRERREAFAKQEVWQATRARFGKMPPLDTALHILEEQGFLRRETVNREGPGRPPAPRWEVSPHAYNPYNPYKSEEGGQS
ncbi:MAG: DUF3987 domain-containing protein [Chloroflexi bacterium]|nr:DUF3987 domain-containing protein [Chloroflexota bacterium]